MGISKRYNVTVDEEFGKESDGDFSFMADGLAVTGTGFMTTETDDMKQLKKLYKQKREIKSDAAYIFILKKAKTDDGSEVAGDMPRSHQVGYVFSEDAKYSDAATIAHELGHGLYSFEHTFENKGAKQGSTDNLMDYNDGVADKMLKVWQWNLLYTHKNYTVPFLEDDEDAMKKINGFNIEIVESSNYHGETYGFDRGYDDGIVTQKFRKCYSKFEGTNSLIPIIYVPNNVNMIEFKLYFNSKRKDAKEIKIICDSKKIHFDGQENGISVEIPDENSIDIKIENISVDVMDLDEKHFISIVDVDENNTELAKIQCVKLNPVSKTYKLVYLTNKDGEKLNNFFDENVFHQKLTKYHSHLFVEWTKEPSETLDVSGLGIGESNSKSESVLQTEITKINDKLMAAYMNTKYSNDNEYSDKPTPMDIYKFRAKHSIGTAIYFISNYNFGSVGGVTNKFGAYGTTVIDDALDCSEGKSRKERIYENTIHEFGHLAGLPDAKLCATTQNNKDYAFISYSDDPEYSSGGKDPQNTGRTPTNIMYYLIRENRCNTYRIDWYKYQVEIAQKFKDIYTDIQSKMTNESNATNESNK